MLAVVNMIAGDFISVTRSNGFGFSRKFMDSHNIPDSPYIVLFYDKANHEIAFHFTDTIPKYGYSLHSGAKPQHGSFIICRRFFKDNNMDNGRFSGRYPYSVLPVESLCSNSFTGDAYVIKLKDSN
jgi:hypothetical protein